VEQPARFVSVSKPNIIAKLGGSDVFSLAKSESDSALDSESEKVRSLERLKVRRESIIAASKVICLQKKVSPCTNILFPWFGCFLLVKAASSSAKPRLEYMVWIFLMAYIPPNKDPAASDLICLLIVIVDVIFLLLFSSSFFLGEGDSYHSLAPLFTIGNSKYTILM